MEEVGVDAVEDEEDGAGEQQQDQEDPDENQEEAHDDEGGGIIPNPEPEPENIEPGVLSIKPNGNRLLPSCKVAEPIRKQA